MDDIKQELMYKILVVGDIGTGKTSFIKRYVHNIFSIYYKATIGVDFALKIVPWSDDLTVKLQLWDIAGQERFSNMTRVYFKEAVAAFIVFDVTRVTTLECVKKWKTDIDNKVKLSDSEKSIPVILLANKIDLVEHDEYKYCEKTKEEIDEFCKENGFASWFEISAKDNINIDQAGNAIVREILKNVEVTSFGETDNSSKSDVDLDNDKQVVGQGCCF